MSPSILTISWQYIRMLGASGLRKATEVAILNANYLASRLSGHFQVLYTGANGRVAHECIIDLRPYKRDCGVGAEDVAKRLMDYGFHAPTVSWPVQNTLMIEPTESESKEEIDRFCDAMIEIKKELTDIKSGKYDREDNPIKNSPHTMKMLVDEDWTKTYSREKAVFPTKWVEQNKFWPVVARVDSALGDRNLQAKLDA